MRAMLARVSPVEARPVNSSIVFGGCPAALTRTGDSINSAIACPAYATVRRRFRPERIALRPDCESSKAPTHPGLVPMQACRVTPGNSFGSRKALVSTAPARPLVLVQGGRTAQEVWGRDDLVRRDSCKWRAQSSPVGVVGAAKAGQARLCGSDVVAIGSPPRAGMPPAWATYVWVDDADAVAASTVKAGGSVLAEPFGSLDGGRMAIVADPAGAVFGVWTPGDHRGAQRVNEPSAYSMSFLRTPDLDGAEAFYGAVLGWTTEAFGPWLLWRLPGYVGGVPEQPVSREVVAVMARARDGEAAHWRVDFWIADADAAAARATQLGGSVVAAPEDAGPFREAVLADPAGATFSVSQLTAGP